MTDDARATEERRATDAVRKRDIPLIYSGWAAKFTFIAIVTSLVAALGIEGEDELRMGVIDTSIGILCGVVISGLAFPYILRFAEHAFLTAGGSLIRVQPLLWPADIIAALFFFAAAVPPILVSSTLCSALGLAWPWCGAPFGGGAAYMLGLLYRYAAWYDKLSD